MSTKFSGYPGKIFSFIEADLDAVDFMHSVCVVGVSGNGPNIFGHGLLCVRDYYFHVDEPGFDQFPKWMNQSGYERYMKENKKKE